MQRTRKKLNSRRGASLLFAILVFLLCVLAGTGALTAASANAGRYTHLVQDEQKYLSVTSAAGLLRSQLDEQSFTAKATLTETVTWHYKSDGNDPPSYTLVEDPAVYALDPLVDPTFEGKLLGTLLSDYCEQRFQSGDVPADFYTKAGKTRPTAPDAPKAELTVSGEGDELAESLGEVTAGLTVDDQYGLRLTLAGPDGAYPTTLYLPATVERTTETTIKTTGNVPTADSGTRTTVTTLTVKVTWPQEKAVLLRGTDEEGGG